MRSSGNLNIFNCGGTWCRCRYHHRGPPL